MVISLFTYQQRSGDRYDCKKLSIRILKIIERKLLWTNFKDCQEWQIVLRQSFPTKYYICDTDWTIRELESSEGYLVNDEVYKVGADPKLYTVEYNTTANDVVEQVLKGKIAIIKHTNDGSTQIETPEKGAEIAFLLFSLNTS